MISAELGLLIIVAAAASPFVIQVFYRPSKRKLREQVRQYLLTMYAKKEIFEHPDRLLEDYEYLLTTSAGTGPWEIAEEIRRYSTSRTSIPRTPDTQYDTDYDGESYQ